VNLTHEGLSLWYGTPDAPAPLGELASRTEASVTVGVRPANPTNGVHVRFRVDGGFERSEPARELRTDLARNAQYFGLKFPDFKTGSVVEYCPVLTCVGRQVPGPTAARFPSKFLLPPVTPAKRSLASQPKPAELQRFSPDLEFLAAVSIKFDRPDFIGETPEGVRVDYYALEGTVTGPRLNGTVVPRSNDHLFVRPDGIGVVQVRAAVRTNDGAMLEIEYKGNIELGEDGYARALKQQFAPTPSLVICPRILTGHPKYRWLNRVQCLAIGRVTLADLTLEYDAFTVKTRAFGNVRSP
jgi:Protein of unknown function (DUF3237)